MSIERITATTGGWTAYSSETVTGSFAATDGNAIVVFSTNYTEGGGRSVAGVTDSAGNTYSKVGTSGGMDSNHTMECWLATDITGGGAVTVTVTYASDATYRTVFAVQYSGLGGYDAESSFVTTSDAMTHTSGSVTTTATGTVCLAFYVANHTYGINSATTPNVLVATAGGCAIVDRLATAAGAYTLEASAGTTEETSQIIKAYAFSAAGGGGGTSDETPAAMLMGV